MASNQLQQTQTTHDLHPSLNNLGGVVSSAKHGISDALAPRDYKVKRVPAADDLESGVLRVFKDGGDRRFRVLRDGLPLFADKAMQQPSENIRLEKDCIVPGTFVYADDAHNENARIVLLGDPFNAYCRAHDVEPADLQRLHDAESPAAEAECESETPHAPTQSMSLKLTVAGHGHSPQGTMQLMGSDEDDDEVVSVQSLSPSSKGANLVDAGSAGPATPKHTESVSVSVCVCQLNVHFVYESQL